MTAFLFLGKKMLTCWDLLVLQRAYLMTADSAGGLGAARLSPTTEPLASHVTPCQVPLHMWPAAGSQLSSSVRSTSAQLVNAARSCSSAAVSAAARAGVSIQDFLLLC